MATRWSLDRKPSIGSGTTDVLSNDWPGLTESLATDWLKEMPESSCMTHWFLRFVVVDTQSVDTTIVRTGNMQICHSLRCRQIDMSTADQFTATFRSNAGMPL